MPRHSAKTSRPSANAHCPAGRVTGADQWGKLLDRHSLVPGNEKCTNIDAHNGDSGGPVYTLTSRATTRAVGVVAKILSRALGKRGKTCSVPIEPRTVPRQFRTDDRSTDFEHGCARNVRGAVGPAGGRERRPGSGVADITILARTRPARVLHQLPGVGVA
jgi:hypothetical protein